MSRSSRRGSSRASWKAENNSEEQGKEAWLEETADVLTTLGGSSRKSEPSKSKGKRRGSTRGGDVNISAIRRRSSASLSDNHNNRRYPLPCRDARPQRLTQPLLQTAPVTHSTTHTATAADLVALSDVWHPLPDTYSLAFAAQLLGFAVPPTVPENNTTSTISYDPATLPLRQDVAYQHIPPLGTFASSIWQAPPPAQPLHPSPDLEDQQTLDVLDPVYQQLLQLHNTEIDQDMDETWGPPMSTSQSQRLWEWLVQACGGTNNQATANKSASSASRTTPREFFSKALAEIQQITGKQFSVHAYRPNNNVTPDGDAFTVAPPVDCTALHNLSTYRDAPLGLVLSLQNYAVGALLFDYRYCTVPAALSSNTLQLHWCHLLLDEAEIDSDANSLVAVVLIALSLQHARHAAAVNYGTYESPSTAPPPYGDLFQACFRLVPLHVRRRRQRQILETVQDANTNNTASDGKSLAEDSLVQIGEPATSLSWNAGDDDSGTDFVTEHVILLADLNKSNTKYALLTWKKLMKEKADGHFARSDSSKSVADSSSIPTKYRSLIRLPNVDEATSLMEGRLLRRKKLPGGTNAISFYASAPAAQRNVTVQLQAVLGKEDDSVQVFATAPGRKKPVDIPNFIEEPMGFHVMKTFELCDKPKLDDDKDTDLLLDLKAKQAEVSQIEKDLEPRLRTLMTKVVQERLDFETSDYWAKLREEERIMEENQKMLERRLAKDEEKQKQLEQDMDAVCCVCNDGEVTPDNQIIFCESCDVPVHQHCYGVEKIPSEDYYCLACRHLGLDASKQTSNDDSGRYPIICSLCPHREGALIRSNIPYAEDDARKIGTWVHVVCAKWQGLDFVNPKKHDLIEDFSELRDSFRRLRIQCSLCQGDRGCMNKCRQEGCQNWAHILCARSSGLCEVNHGEDCHGDVPENPWTLLCAEHSNIDADNIPENAVPLSKLVKMAKEFPPEPEPVLQPIAPMPFNAATGYERKRLLADSKYEQELIYELLFRRHFGERCEVCDALTDVPKDLVRCMRCAISFCKGCHVAVDSTEGGYKCPVCCFVDSPSNGTSGQAPCCKACFQKGGPLRPAVATPLKKTSSARKEYNKYKDMWVHTLCAYWHEGLYFSQSRPGTVDFRDVVTPRSKHGLILDKVRCEVCGQMGGLKMACSHPGCLRKQGEEHVSLYFHPTCARQAGLEVSSENGKSHVKCYRHGGNDYNIRAHLEDLIEIEKRRAGKTFAKADNPMKFSEGSRILNSAIRVLRVLGWSWRWAEWWVDYNSSWEPLLEPGEKEEEMTKEQLKIVDSTRESRAKDARLCRLSAFGAALRNRAYDTEEGFDTEALNRALLAILRTPSLVGPMEEYEIEFLVDWLARAYRSKSRLLGFGDDKIPVAEEAFCMHMEDGTAKFRLGDRPIPGKQKLERQQIYEVGVQEVDDFLKTEILHDIILPSKPPSAKKRPPRNRNRKAPPLSSTSGPSTDLNQSVEPKTPTRKRDRKRKRDSGNIDGKPSTTDSLQKLDAPQSSRRRGPGRPPKTENIPEQSERRPSRAARPTKFPTDELDPPTESGGESPEGEATAAKHRATSASASDEPDRVATSPSRNTAGKRKRGRPPRKKPNPPTVAPPSNDRDDSGKTGPSEDLQATGTSRTMRGYRRGNPNMFDEEDSMPLNDLVAQMKLSPVGVSDSTVNDTSSHDNADEVASLDESANEDVDLEDVEKADLEEYRQRGRQEGKEEASRSFR